MAIGDGAVAAGMQLVNGATTPANQLDDEDNRTRDYIAQYTKAERDARIAGLGNKADKPSDGAAYARLEPGSSHSVGFYTLADSTLMFRPVQTTSAYDRKVTTGNMDSTSVTRPGGGTVEDALNATYANADGRVSKAGDTMSGPLRLLSADPVTSGYAALYRNGDGRLGISPSAARFKKNIRNRAYTLDDLLRIRVVSYQLRAALFDADDPDRGDSPVDVGVIAEELIDAGLPEFVVFDTEGQPLSVHYERLALVAIGALQDLAHQLDGIAERLSALENR